MNTYKIWIQKERINEDNDEFENEEEFPVFETECEDEADEMFNILSGFEDRPKNYYECPFCGSDAIEGSAFDVDGSITSQHIGCLDCNAEWLALYQLTKIVKL